MDQTDLDKAAAKLAREARAAQPAERPPTGAAFGATSTPQPGTGKGAHRVAHGTASLWTPSSRPVPALTELCTRSLVANKLQ